MFDFAEIARSAIAREEWLERLKTMLPVHVRVGTAGPARDSAKRLFWQAGVEVVGKGCCTVQIEVPSGHRSVSDDFLEYVLECLHGWAAKGYPVTGRVTDISLTRAA